MSGSRWFAWVIEDGGEPIRWDPVPGETLAKAPGAVVGLIDIQEEDQTIEVFLGRQPIYQTPNGAFGLVGDDQRVPAGSHVAPQAGMASWEWDVLALEMSAVAQEVAGQ